MNMIVPVLPVEVLSLIGEYADWKWKYYWRNGKWQWMLDTTKFPLLTTMLIESLKFPVTASQVNCYAINSHYKMDMDVHLGMLYIRTWNVRIVIPSQGLDVMTYRCDYHVILDGWANLEYRHFRIFSDYVFKYPHVPWGSRYCLHHHIPHEMHKEASRQWWSQWIQSFYSIKQRVYVL